MIRSVWTQPTGTTIQAVEILGMGRLTATGVVSAGVVEHILVGATQMVMLRRQIAPMPVTWLTTNVMKVRVARLLINQKARKR